MIIIVVGGFHGELTGKLKLTEIFFRTSLEIKGKGKK